uniref:LAGLIDADG endonuclease n=1 Tax=Juglanconis oblonga TaxID=1940568 RepID=A0A291LIP5_9PEZI|nr:LAGLIDADG endonuclease [Juglanconis oblonga]ATI20411.1 LAGLIDADG endonuclease [Juglanconis oblonga]
MVTNQKIIEREMGNRGSKSVVVNDYSTVKEQRVDGSYIGGNSPTVLRCMRFCLFATPMRANLMGFERSYQVKILSNQINKVRWYTSILPRKPIVTPQNKTVNPWFLTGFSDAESSFSILIQPNSKYSTGWRIKPVFAIGLHKKDLELLKNIQSYLGVGKIHIHSKNSIQYRVDSIKELQVIINHFDNFPLVTVKRIDFLLFKKAFNIILLKEHLSQKGLLNLVGIKASLNLGLNTSLIEAFPNWKELQVNKANYIFQGIPDSNWMAGFASGDSSFNIKISASLTSSSGGGNLFPRSGGTSSPLRGTSLLNQRVQLRFGIGLNIREKALIQSLSTYFDLNDKINNVYFYNDSVRFEVVKFSDIEEKIIPFFEKHPIQGKKSLDFRDFKQVAGIIKSKAHLTSEGLAKILKIKVKMNE